MFICLVWGQGPKFVYQALGPIWQHGYVRGEENDQISSGMEDYIKKKVEVTIREGYTTRIRGALVRQVLKYLNRPSRNFQWQGWTSRMYEGDKNAEIFKRKTVTIAFNAL